MAPSRRSYGRSRPPYSRIRSYGRTSSTQTQSRHRTSRNLSTASQAASASRSESHAASRRSTTAPPPSRSASINVSADQASFVDGGDADIDADILNEVIMAVNLVVRQGVGCAYYVARTEQLFLMEDVKLGNVHVIEQLKMYVQPTVILVPTDIDDAIVDALDPELRQQQADRESTASFTATPLDLRPKSEFLGQNGKNKLLSLDIEDLANNDLRFCVPGEGAGDEHDIGRPQEQAIKMGGLINLESSIGIGCAGAVISYLNRRRAASFLPGDHAAQNMFRVSFLQCFTLKDKMYINEDTLLALQVIQPDFHPNIQNQGPNPKGSKEGLSVYGLFHFLAKTSQGRQLLRQWFMQPSLDAKLIQARHNAVEVLTDPANSELLENLVSSMKHIKNMRYSLVNLRKGVTATAAKVGVKVTSNVSIWTSIRLFAFHALQIKDFVRHLRQTVPLPIRDDIDQFFDAIGLANVGQRITDIIDFEESALQNRAVVMTHVDAELDQLRHEYEGLESRLSQVCKELAREVPADWSSLINAIYFPQIGFLIAVEKRPELDANQLFDQNGQLWDKIFVTEHQEYYKNTRMRELDESWGDIWTLICDKEIEILHGLAQSVLESEGMLVKISDICGELDCLLALARGSQDYNLCRPQLSDANIIDIRKGRHILQELVVPSFVPNDTLLLGGAGDDATDAGTDSRRAHKSSENMSDGPHVIVLTGPNFSGKSIYLKQVALIVYMAQIGSYVPAEYAKVGLTDKILTRISTRESVSRRQSAFMIDLQQISLALNLLTPKSLLIIDEFGKGTESDDGAGLSAGVLEYLIKLGDQCPKVIAATHFHEIFEHGFIKSSSSLSFAHLEVRVDHERTTQNRGIADRIAYLHNIRPGRSISSFGTVCAALNGISEEIVKRAEDLLLLESRGEDLVAACAVMPDAELQRLTEAEDIARSFLDASAESLLGGHSLLSDLLASSTGVTATGQTSTAYDRTTTITGTRTASGTYHSLLTM